MSEEIFKKKLLQYLDELYNPYFSSKSIYDEIFQILNFDKKGNFNESYPNWSEKDVFVISYADSIYDSDESPLLTLNNFLLKYTESINSVHILPFMPSSSDSGFAVKNYTSIDPKFGSWNDLNLISRNFNVMIDLVLNHASFESDWFNNYRNGVESFEDYFIEVKNWSGTAQIVRPRTNSLFQKVKTKNGLKYLWCTFSHDQVDLNFKNPKILLEFVKIFKFYIDKNIKNFRLDAIAFIWKKQNTSCLNQPETHIIIKIFRLIISAYNNKTIILTETNIPNKENLSYFGKSDEAHWIYNFTLSPLILFTMLSGNCSMLRKWSMTMPPAKKGNTYFNFLASHDGIGLRPVEGYLSENEIKLLLERMQSFGGKISYRTSQWGDQIPYEINISLIDSMKGTFLGNDNHQVARFICAHTMMLSFEGIPAIYIHSLLGTKNNYQTENLVRDNRIINRYCWEKDDIYKLLNNSESLNAIILHKLNHLLKIRILQPAFHPNATQFTLNLGNQIFGLWRQDIDRNQSIFCIFNITSNDQEITLESINLIETDDWFDLISKRQFISIDTTIHLEPYQTLWITNRHYE